MHQKLLALILSKLKHLLDNLYHRIISSVKDAAGILSLTIDVRRAVSQQGLQVLCLSVAP